MPDNQRTTPPRGSAYVFPAILLALVGCFGIFFVWYQNLNPVQKHFLGMYAKSSYTKRLKPAHELLKHQLYANQDLPDFANTPLIFCGILLGLSVVVGVTIGSRKKKEATDGIRLEGPELVTRYRFNRLIGGKGFHFMLANRRNLWELFRGEKGKRLYFPADDTASQIMLQGDPRQGKSLLFSQILEQAFANGWAVWSYDPHGEYFGRFADEARGYYLVNPLDVRGCSWNPLSEIDLSDWGRAISQAQQIAVSLYPGEPTDKYFFFTEKARELFVHLLVHHQPASAKEFGEWMAAPDKHIDPRIAGTELEHYLAKNSPGQRNGILAVFSRIAIAFRLIPEEDGNRPVLCIREWMKYRRQPIFFTSDADNRGTLRPLHSLLIDMGIRAFISQGRREDVPQTLLALEELPTLQELPTLHSSLTESPKTGLNIMMAFQGESQIRNLYRELTDAIMSAPPIKVYFHTEAANASEWIAKTIGKQRILQLVRTYNSKGGHTEQMQEKERELFMSGTISKLPALNGILTFGGYAMRVKVPIPKQSKAEMLRVAPFIPRQDKPVVKHEIKAVVPPAPEPVQIPAASASTGGIRLAPIRLEDQSNLFETKARG
jgi:hypothetical protein